ncbi:MAG: hypothetical protein IJ785_05050 [Bacteroidales bacterium]|nr:hypothetical protein [Bacteroidales bacterium]
MIEKIVIQNDSSAIRKVEDYIAAVCYENHLDNYHATIAVPVLSIVRAVVDRQTADIGSMVLQSDYCREGVFFNITSSSDCFHQNVQGYESSPTLLADSLSLAAMLTDEMRVLDDGRTLQLIFHLRGIASRETERRKNVLERFYSTVLVEA